MESRSCADFRVSDSPCLSVERNLKRGHLNMPRAEMLDYPMLTAWRVVKIHFP